MELHKQNFANMPAAETNPIDCGGFPRRDTNVFLPRSVFRNTLDQKASY